MENDKWLDYLSNREDWERKGFCCLHKQKYRRRRRFSSETMRFAVHFDCTLGPEFWEREKGEGRQMRYRCRHPRESKCLGLLVSLAHVSLFLNPVVLLFPTHVALFPSLLSRSSPLLSLLPLSPTIFVCLRPSAVRDSASPAFVHGCLIYGSL